MRLLSQLTKEIFGSFMDDVKPKDVFVAATVGQEGNVVQCLQVFGYPDAPSPCTQDQLGGHVDAGNS